MPIEDDPQYQKWSVAFDMRNEAQKRYWRAKIRNDSALAAYKHDMDLAQQAYDDVCSEL